MSIFKKILSSIVNRYHHVYFTYCYFIIVHFIELASVNVMCDQINIKY